MRGGVVLSSQPIKSRTGDHPPCALRAVSNIKVHPTPFGGDLS